MKPPFLPMSGFEPERRTKANTRFSKFIYVNSEECTMKKEVYLMKKGVCQLSIGIRKNRIFPSRDPHRYLRARQPGSENSKRYVAYSRTGRISLTRRRTNRRVNKCHEPDRTTPKYKKILFKRPDTNCFYRDNQTLWKGCLTDKQIRIRLISSGFMPIDLSA